jgi:hypothetical protein
METDSKYFWYIVLNKFDYVLHGNRYILCHKHFTLLLIITNGRSWPLKVELGNRHPTGKKCKSPTTSSPRLDPGLTHKCWENSERGPATSILASLKDPTWQKQKNYKTKKILPNMFYTIFNIGLMTY